MEIKIGPSATNIAQYFAETFWLKCSIIRILKTGQKKLPTSVENGAEYSNIS